MHVKHKSLIYIEWIIDIKNTRTRCEICLKLTIRTPELFFYCWLWTCTRFWVDTFIFIVWMIFITLIIFIGFMIYQKYWNLVYIVKLARGHSHIDFRTQCVIMKLAGGGLLLMTFWNCCSYILIYFCHDYLIIDGKRSFIN